MSSLMLVAWVAVSVSAGPVKKSPLVDRSKALVTAWAGRDAKKVLAMFDPASVVVSGPDVAEVCHDAPCAEKLLRDGFALFDSAKAGELEAVSVQEGGGLGTVFFDVKVEVAVGGEKKTQVQRFATTWRLAGAEWRLVQLARSVPTVERPAREILKENVLK